MTDDRTFFEIAAALLPALMLAALFSDRLKPPPESAPAPAPRWPFWLLLFCGAYFLFAETAALSAAITGEPSDYDRIVVSIALIAAALGTVLLVLIPWIQDVEPGKRRGHVIALAVVLLIQGVSAVRILNSSIDTASLQEQTDEFLRESRANAESERLLRQQEVLIARRSRLQRELSPLLHRRSPQARAAAQTDECKRSIQACVAATRYQRNQIADRNRR
jgi:hypothetical protein